MTVFANNLEVSAKAQGCKVIAAVPDTCFTPPQTPATPPGVPIPHPNFGQDSDMTSGSGKVLIGGKEISLENSSSYSKCTGDEAGAAPEKGILTSKTTGEVFAKKWSMDVKVEGKGVVRFSDMATTNHGCDPGQPPPVIIVGTPGAGFMAHNVNCCVGSYDTIEAECSKRGGQRHHIIPDVYGLKVSADLVSRVTDAVLEEVSDWQNRALEPMFPIVFLDALRVKIRDAESRQVKNKAVYVALGVTPEGEREVLG